VTISFSGKAYRILVDLVYEHSRIRLGADKQTLLANRLQKRLRALGLKSYDDYCAILESAEGSEEIEELVDLISTNHTKFFREPDPQLGFLWGGLTMGMLLSVPMIIAGAIIIVVAWRRQIPKHLAKPAQGRP
jgi:hypothetical protein